MIKNIFFPLIMLWAFLFSMCLASIKLSYFFADIDFFSCFLILLMLILMTLIPVLLPMKNKFITLKDKNKNSVIFLQLAIVFIFFLIELRIFGVPLLEFSRDDFTGFKVLHVAFYGFMFYLNAKSASLGSFSISLATFTISTVLGALLLSRQLMMYSFLALFFSLLLAGKIKIKTILVLLLLMVFLFGFLGDLRQSGGNDFIYKVGGANDLGQQIPSGLYWTWLYITSPIYNLLYNIGDSIFLLRFENPSAFFAQIFLPDFLANRFEVVQEGVSLVVEHLNVASGFGLSAKYAGLLGVLIHSLAILVFYLFGKIITLGKYKRIFVVHFSICSIFFVFDNTFTRAEYFIVFIYIFIFSFFSAVSVSHSSPMLTRSERMVP